MELSPVRICLDFIVPSFPDEVSVSTAVLELSPERVAVTPNLSVGRKWPESPKTANEALC